MGPIRDVMLTYGSQNARPGPAGRLAKPWKRGPSAADDGQLLCPPELFDDLREGRDDLLALDLGLAEPEVQEFRAPSAWWSTIIWLVSCIEKQY